MKQARYNVSCPKCGHDTVPTNIGEPVDGGTTANAILRCVNQWCKMEWGLHVYLMPIGVYTDEGTIHGNRRAYNAHKRKSERVCEACNAWHARDQDDKKHSRELTDA